MVRGLEIILTDRRKLDWGDAIVKLDPKAYPFVVLCNAMGKEKAINQVFISFEDRPWVRWGYVDNYAGGGGIDFNLHAATGGSGAELGKYINVDDILWNVTQDSFMFVVSVVGQVITVINNYSGRGVANMALASQSGKTFDTGDSGDDTSDTITNDDVILKVSNTWEDGGVAATPKAIDLTKVFNFIQKFKSSFTVDEETMMSELNGQPELQRLQARKAVEHAKDIEYQMLFGKKDARIFAASSRAASAGKYIYTTGGLYQSGMANDSGIGAVTETDVRSFLRSGFRYGASEKVFFMGGLLAEAIDTWALSRLRLNDKAKKLGLTMMQYLYAGNIANLVRHPLLEDDLEGMGFLIDFDYLKMKVFSDTVLETGLQANDAEERLDQYKTRVGQKLGLLECHRMISGITSIA